MYVIYIIIPVGYVHSDDMISSCYDSTQSSHLKNRNQSNSANHPLAAISSPKLCISMTTESSLDALRLGKSQFVATGGVQGGDFRSEKGLVSRDMFCRFDHRVSQICNSEFTVFVIRLDEMNSFLQKNLSSTDCVCFFCLCKHGSPFLQHLILGSGFSALKKQRETRSTSELKGIPIMQYHDWTTVDLKKL